MGQQGQVSTAAWLVEMQDTQPKPAFEIRDCVLHVAHKKTRQCLATPATHYGAGQRVDSTGVAVKKTAHMSHLSPRTTWPCPGHCSR
jgi:hypothetical protein